MKRDAERELADKRLRRNSLLAAIGAVVLSSAFLVAAGHWFGNWGFLAAAFVAMITIESVRRASNLRSLVRLGAAVGLLVGWLLHRYY
jgi:uncharacterized membrane protein YjjP (DUF1212 family)